MYTDHSKDLLKLFADCLAVSLPILLSLCIRTAYETNLCKVKRIKVALSQVDPHLRPNFKTESSLKPTTSTRSRTTITRSSARMVRCLTWSIPTVNQDSSSSSTNLTCPSQQPRAPPPSRIRIKLTMLISTQTEAFLSPRDPSSQSSQSSLWLSTLDTTDMAATLMRPSTWELSHMEPCITITQACIWHQVRIKATSPMCLRCLLAPVDMETSIPTSNLTSSIQLKVLTQVTPIRILTKPRCPTGTLLSLSCSTLTPL